MAGITVDEMGNVWDGDDTVRDTPLQPHPELEGDDALCPSCGAYKYRVKLTEKTFEWRCSCGQVFEGFHH